MSVDVAGCVHQERAEEAAEPALVALDACIVALQVASQPNMPQQVCPNQNPGPIRATARHNGRCR